MERLIVICGLLVASVALAEGPIWSIACDEVVGDPGHQRHEQLKIVPGRNGYELLASDGKESYASSGLECIRSPRSALVFACQKPGSRDERLSTILIRGFDRDRETGEPVEKSFIGVDGDINHRFLNLAFHEESCKPAVRQAEGLPAE